MDFSLGSEIEKFRREARLFFKQWVDGSAGFGRYIGGKYDDRDIQRALGTKGWLTLEDEGTITWDMKMFVLSEEADRLGIYLQGLATTMMVGFTLLQVATAEQKAKYIPGIVSGETRICLGYSEPGAGSDIAGITTRAKRDGEDWIINGQKQWTSWASSSDYIWLLTRSDPDAKRHSGLTVFCVPMSTPGISILPISLIASTQTYQVFFADVRIPDHLRVGEAHRGWQVLAAALTYEHGGGNVPGRSLTGSLQRILDIALAFLRTDPACAEDPAVLERIAAIATDLEIGRLFSYRTTWEGAHTEKADVPGAIAKVHTREAILRASEALLEIVGNFGLESVASEDGEIESIAASAAQFEFLMAPIGTTAGGSMEIQRTIIAERGLRLPRPPRG